MKILFLIITLFVSGSIYAQNQTNEAGRKIGYWKITGADKSTPGYSDDAIVEEGEFMEGRKVGVWKAYYPSGELKSEITYDNGRPKGPYTTYYNNGQIEEKGNWSLNKNQGKFTRYYENGQVQQDFTFDDSGKRNGTQKYFHENGQLMMEGSWNGGKEDGEIKEYFANGDLKSVRVFNGGRMDASKSTFNKPSKPEVAATKQPEPVKDENNKVKTTRSIQTAEAKPNIGNFDGNGQHTLYNKNRQISQKGIFKDGRLMDGKVYRYTRDGILTKVEVYQNGSYVGDGVITDDMK
ncbi:MAG: toxin-antitoxin system YwqK family antitoxin [Salibacteraceae bacterium]